MMICSRVQWGQIYSSVVRTFTALSRSTHILLSNKFEESKIYFDVGVEAKDYYRIKDRNKQK